MQPLLPGEFFAFQDRLRSYSCLVVQLSVLLFFLFSLLSLNSCATRYQPQPTDRISIVDNYAMLETDNVAVAIRPRFWTREPQKISDFFTTFHIIIKNQADHSITVSPEDIVLLDEDKNQYDVFTVSEVSQVLFYDDVRIEKFSPLPDRRFDSPPDDRMTARANLMQEAFHFGNIRSGARKSGFIFFRRLPARNTESTIIFLDEEIVFIRQ